MGFWKLFEVASMPILQVLVIGGLGAFMASGYCNTLPPDARRSMNKIVFTVFTPSLTFASLAKTVTLGDIISWWFMPVNVGLTFLFGAILGWFVVKLLKPPPHLEGLVVAACSSANLGNLVVILVPAICHEDGSPFGDHSVCASIGRSYASFSMALGGFYLWTYTYQLMRSSATKYKALCRHGEARNGYSIVVAKQRPNKDFDDNPITRLLTTPANQDDSVTQYDPETSTPGVTDESCCSRVREALRQIIEELMAPPTLGAIMGLIFGTITWLKNLIIGDNAPLHVIQDSIKLLGDGTIPCITLILGGNLTQGLWSRNMRPSIITGIIIVKYLLLPVIGVGVVKLAHGLGFLPPDPLYEFVLMVQFTLPPAMNIAIMTQLFDMGQEECSVLFLWTYIVAAFALTFWSTVYMWILSSN